MSVTKENTEALTVTDDTRDIETNRVNEKVVMEENTSVGVRKTLGHSWIVGSSTNGIVGTNTGTEDGSQQVVGSAGRVSTTQWIVNPNNTYREHFKDTDFKDAGNTTATWTTTGTVSFTSEQRAWSKSVEYNAGTIKGATLYAEGTNLSDFQFALTADGGSNWEGYVNINEAWTFTNTGTDLRWVANCPTGCTGTITLIRIKTIK